MQGEPSKEPLHPYLVSLGFKLSGRYYHEYCFWDMVKRKGWEPER